MSPKKVTERLSALDVKRLGLGLHLDGRNLYLQVTERGRSWVFRYKSPTRGKVRDMGLGSTVAITLGKAREMAGAARALVATGVDPIDARDADRIKAQLAAAKSVTFRKAAETYIASVSKTWRNPKHKQQWTNTLTTYAYPVFGGVAVQDVDTPLVAKALHLIWHGKAETGSRVRGRIETILDSAKALGQRAGENPAALDAIVAALGKQTPKKARVRHHPALPFAAVPGFMVELRAENGVAARALEFAVLCASRTGEVTGATWAEFEIDKAEWVVPGERMKSKRPHRVPLNDRALEILAELRELRLSDDPKAYVFPGGKKGKPLSENAMLALLKRMERMGITPHGFRSSFKDFCAERTNFDNVVSEAALAHVVGDATEAAYRRGDLYEKRKKLMDAWGRYCTSPPPADAGNVVVAIGAGRALA